MRNPLKGAIIPLHTALLRKHHLSRFTVGQRFVRYRIINILGYTGARMDPGINPALPGNQHGKAGNPATESRFAQGMSE